jgi:hypothetical protein
MFYWTDDVLNITCGCYITNSIKEFKDRVQSVYGEGKNEKYYNEYMEEIKKFKLLVKKIDEVCDYGD